MFVRLLRHRLPSTQAGTPSATATAASKVVNHPLPPTLPATALHAPWLALRRAIRPRTALRSKIVSLATATRPSLTSLPPPSLPCQGDAATAAPAPADDAEVLHFRVCHKGGVRLRSSPTDNPGPDATVLPEGTLVKARRMPVTEKGLELVEICDSEAYSGFLPIKAKGYTALEVVPGDRDEAGAWWYRVVATDGMHFAKEPKLDSPRHEAVHANGTIMKAVRQLAPAGSLVMFVELENDQGKSRWYGYGYGCGGVEWSSVCAVQCSTVQCSTGADQYSAIQHCAMQYSWWGRQPIAPTTRLYLPVCRVCPSIAPV